jgi:hypothetical protein
VEVHVEFGTVCSGRSRVFMGWWVQVGAPEGGSWLEQDRHSLRRALRAVEKQLNADGLSLRVMGLDPEWMESGLSANSGYGYHPDFDGPIHMFDSPAI